MCTIEGFPDVRETISILILLGWAKGDAVGRELNDWRGRFRSTDEVGVGGIRGDQGGGVIAERHVEHEIRRSDGGIVDLAGEDVFPDSEC